VYDRTGSLEDTEALSGEQFDSLYNFYRSIYAPVSEADIDAFASSFRGGTEERADLLRHYTEFEGNMAKVFDWVMLSDPDRDAHRFMDAIEDAIKKGEVERYKQYTTWAKKVAKKPRPSTVKEGSKKGKGKKKKEDGGEAALVAAMTAGRQGGAFQSALSSLAAKYGDPGEEEHVEPTDEEFEAARARIEARKKRVSDGGGDGDGGKKKSKK
jgi:DnaJ family protein C protein 9